MVPSVVTPPSMSTRPIPRTQAPDWGEDGDFEGDDPPTTAEPVREEHYPQIVPRSPSIATRPVPKFRAAQSDDAFDDDANPTMIDPHVPTGGAPRRSFDPHAPIDDNRRTADLSAAARRAMEPTADLGPAARRALAEGGAMPDPTFRDAIPTAPIRKTPLAQIDPLTTAPMGSGSLSSPPPPPSPPLRPRTPPGPTGPMVRPPPDAPPSLAKNASGSQRAHSPTPGLRTSGPARAIPPSAPPPFVADRRAAMAPPPSPPPAPTILQRPAPGFDLHARVDDSSRTQRWEGRPPTGAPVPPESFALPYAPTDSPFAAPSPPYATPEPMYPPAPPQLLAVSHKTPGADLARPYDQRPIPQVQLRPLAELSKTPPHGMGRLAPPHDPNRARTRKTQDVMIWGSVVVMIGSIVTLVIWLIAR